MTFLHNLSQFESTIHLNMQYVNTTVHPINDVNNMFILELIWEVCSLICLFLLSTCSCDTVHLKDIGWSVQAIFSNSFINICVYIYYSIYIMYIYIL